MGQDGDTKRSAYFVVGFKWNLHTTFTVDWSIRCMMGITGDLGIKTQTNMGILTVL